MAATSPRDPFAATPFVGPQTTKALEGLVFTSYEALWTQILIGTTGNAIQPAQDLPLWRNAVGAQAAAGFPGQLTLRQTNVTFAGGKQLANEAFVVRRLAAQLRVFPGAGAAYAPPTIAEIQGALDDMIFVWEIANNFVRNMFKLAMLTAGYGVDVATVGAPAQATPVVRNGARDAIGGLILDHELVIPPNQQLQTRVIIPEAQPFGTSGAGAGTANTGGAVIEVVAFGDRWTQPVG